MSKYEASANFCRVLGLKVPIIQSPMAGVSTAAMAAEVTNNGGLGSIPLGSVDLREGLDQMRKEVDLFRHLAKEHSRNVNLNFFCHEIVKEASKTQRENWWNLMRSSLPSSKAFENSKVVTFANSYCSFREIEERHSKILAELVNYLKTIKPKVVSFHFGIPSKKTIITLQDLGIFVFACITSVEEAKTVISAGIDGIVCQGYEAGGHRGNFLTTADSQDKNLRTNTLFAEVKSYIESYSMPKETFIIPAGGIVSSESVNYYLRSGAAGVQMGTVFLATPESKSMKFFKKVPKVNSFKDTRMTPLISGKRARVIRTDLIEIMSATQEAHSYELPPYGPMYNAFKSLKALLPEEDLGPYLAGENFSRINPQLSTAQIVQNLSRDLTLSGKS